MLIDRGQVRIVESTGADFAAHGEIPIRFTACSKVDVQALIESGGRNIVELQVEPFVKDYDEFGEERPASLGKRFDLANWALVAAFMGVRRVGGAILATRCPSYELLEEQADWAALVDIRIVPESRRSGIGNLLFEHSCEWAIKQESKLLLIETQDTNVAANQFYRSVGCKLYKAERGVYAPLSDEARIIWQKPLR